MRMEVAHHFADDLRALAVTTRGRQPHRLHPVEDATMCRLETVAHVGQRAPDDYAHRVIHVRALHLVFDVDGQTGGLIWVHRFRGSEGSGVPRVIAFTVE